MRDRPTLDEQRRHVSSTCLALPEAESDTATGQHLAFSVRGKKFAYFLVDHHGDGRVALVCKAAPGEASTLIAATPERYFNPPYLGPRGWVGLDLDAPGVTPGDVTGLIRASYALTAPKRLATQMAEAQ
ncbi:MAG TPA: MmcQ/YjbR family DNA-binding protein [Tepidiformaceae bacterium]|nr:MmcQ/YjbR family DNA-binding protein [Tepidiformaceae bacterium]